MKNAKRTLWSALLLAAFWGTAQAQSVPVPPGLISWWRGEGNANDSQGANHGNLVGGAGFAPGMVGQAFSLDGYDDYVQVPANPSLPVGNAPRTVMLWVYTRPSSWGMNQNTIFHSGLWGDYRVAFSLDMHHYREMEFYTWHEDIYFDPQVPAEGWVHAALTYDGLTAKVYTQGQVRGERPYPYGLNTAYADIQIGALSWLAYFDGLIDEVALFNRALSQSEIQAVYNAGSAGMSNNSPPDVSAAAPSIASIWPPNNKMVDIAITGVTDPDGDAVSITITSITNNETGSADASGIGTATAQVRAARNGKGNGRTYTISFTAADGKGGSASGSVQVVVAHDQGKRAKPAGAESASWGQIKSMER